MKTLICPVCSIEHEKPNGEYNRAIKTTGNIYCSKYCSGVARRGNKTIEQKKEEKRIYDEKYRIKNYEILKTKKQEYFKKTYDPIEAAKYRKERMPKHVEYCRQPKYKVYKKKYDKQFLAKKKYGEFYEAAIIVNEIDTITDARETFREKKKYLKSTTTKKRKNEQRNTKCNQP